LSPRTAAARCGSREKSPDLSAGAPQSDANSRV